MATPPRKTGKTNPQPSSTVVHLPNGKMQEVKIDKNKPVYPQGARLPIRVKNNLNCVADCINAPPHVLREFPGTYQPEKPTHGTHPHPTLHWTKVFMEQDGLELLNRLGTKNLMDVGGSPARVTGAAQSFGMSYRVCSPTLTGQDITRHATIPDRFRAKMCGHSLQECNCLGFDALLFTHSAYYFKEKEFCKMVLRGRLKSAVVITHIFKGRQGTLEGEAKWYKNQGVVNMEVNGNGFYYTHENDMEYLGKTGSHQYIDGRVYTFSYNCRKTVAGTHLYLVTGTEGYVELEKKITIRDEEEVSLSEKTMKHFNLERWERLPGFLWIFPRGKERICVHEGLYLRLRLQMAGQFPSKQRYVTLASTARRMIHTDYVDLHEKSWFIDSLNITIALAYVESCVSQNVAQKTVESFMPLMDRLDYGVYTKRDQYGDTIWGKMASLTSDFCEYVGLESPYEQLETSLTPVVNRKLVQTGLYLTSTAVQTTVEVTYNASALMLDRATNLLVPKIKKKIYKKMNHLVEQAYERKDVVSHVTGHPVRYAVDPDQVQSQLDALVAKSVANIPALRRRLSHLKGKEYQDALAKESFKSITPVTIEPNSVTPARVPYVVSAYHGMSNAPSSGDATWYSSIMNRLYDGREHLDYAQLQKWNKATEKVYKLGIFPDNDFRDEYLRDHPVLEPQGWLDHQYGRRDDKMAYKKYYDAIQNEQKWDQPYHCTVFVKDENAVNKGDDNKGRNIFVPDPHWVVQVSPMVHTASKMWIEWSDFTVAKKEGRTPLFFYIAGSDPRKMAQWRGAVRDDLGGQIFAFEIDLSKFEANQAAEQVGTTLNKVGELTKKNPTLLRKQLRLVIKQYRRKHRQTVVCERDGGNASGVPNVSWTNTQNSVTAMIGMFMDLGMTDEQILECIRICGLGDDGLAYMSNELRHFFDGFDIARYYLETYGWVAKAKIIDTQDLGKEEFCSNTFHEQADGTYLYAPKCARFMSKALFLNNDVRDKAVTIRGMLMGVAAVKTGAMLSNMCKILDDKLAKEGVSPPKEEVRVQWSVVPLIGTGDIVVNDDFSSDALRYGISERDLRGFLQRFRTIVNDSAFPYAPVVIPRCYVWDLMCEVDYKVEVVIGDGRVDLSLPNRQIAIIMVYLYYTCMKAMKRRMRMLRESRVLVNLLGRDDRVVGPLGYD